MGIRKIIREEIEGFLDSSEEDFEWVDSAKPTWDKETLLHYLNEHGVMEVFIMEGMESNGAKYISKSDITDYYSLYTLKLYGGCNDTTFGTDISVHWDNTCMGYDFKTILKNLNRGWVLVEK